MTMHSAVYFAFIFILFGGIVIVRDRPDQVMALQRAATISLSRESSALSRLFLRESPHTENVSRAGVSHTDMEGRTGWAIDLAKRLGNDDPSPDIIAWIVAWQRAEGTTASHNPLATTYYVPGASCFNHVCVRNYQSRDEGLDATVATLSFNYPGYVDIREGIRGNDPDRAQRGLAASPWGTNAAVVQSIYAERITTPPFLACRENTLAIYRRLAVRLMPGESWSFNESVGDPKSLAEIVVCNGVYGGGWCNIAGRISYVARAMGLSVEFQPHTPPHNDPTPLDNVAIWNVDGRRGSEGNRRDLIVTNTSSVVIAWLVDDDGRVVAWRE